MFEELKIRRKITTTKKRGEKENNFGDGTRRRVRTRFGVSAMQEDGAVEEKQCKNCLVTGVCVNGYIDISIHNQ